MPIPDEAGRVAVVTGGSHGIGRAIALALASNGIKIAVSARGRDALDATVQLIDAAGGSAIGVECDVTAPDQVDALRARVEAELGAVQILVNNAGAAESAPFLKTSRELWDQTLAVNLTSVYTVTRAFLGGMLDRGEGRVINIASTSGKTGHPYVSAYCAAKHGVVGLTRSLAREVATKGVTVNAVCPSYVDTPMTERTVANIVALTKRSPEQAREALVRDNPQRRLVTPEEVAATVVFLASPGAAAINGQSINLCGGELPT